MMLDSLIGVPYQGDRFCREYARRVLAGHGIPMPTVDTPEQAQEWQRVSHPQPLDVVVFNRAGRPAHVGVCVGRGEFVHVEEGSRSCKERLGSPLWARRVEGFYRYMGVRA
ncbi:hypothetical protein Xmar_07705 [Xanthomonas axonopodis pv. martyniicola]|uniref:NlpC/P60 family protein n=1 Tax=Xanthomonas axonopodis TaxID=53413 RepID=UPI0009978FB1|nr:hypothetical protein Xmar_07705 [Xanthomonas axonopodis pv. martyniicola]OOW90159.1 hypothetical protein Xvtr_19130 [Xanthomonas campestris pv. vitiscarnosae]